MLRLFFVSLWAHANLEAGAFEEPDQPLRRKNFARNTADEAWTRMSRLPRVEANFSVRAHSPVDGVPLSTPGLGCSACSPARAPEVLQERKVPNKKPAVAGELLGSYQAVLQRLQSMHLNTWRWFGFLTQLPLIAFALLLIEVWTLDRLPHLQRPVKTPILLVHPRAASILMSTGSVVMIYLACCCFF